MKYWSGLSYQRLSRNGPLLALLLLLAIAQSFGQEVTFSNEQKKSKKLLTEARIGIGWAYEDEAHLLNISGGFSMDYPLTAGLFVQFAPVYSWLWKWNEHYLTLPIYARKTLGKNFSIFAGPALTFDIGHFRDLGVSAGASYKINPKSTLILSAFTFTLYDYHIDYLYVPVSLSYSHSL